MSRRMGNSDFKPQMEGAGGPQPKKRRKNANAANANAVNNTANTPPTTNPNQNNTPPIGIPPPDLAPPPPISTFGDTIVASNPFDDTPPNESLHLPPVYQNGMMNHVPPHPHHAMRNDPSQYMQPPHYPNHPMPNPPQRSMMNPSMEPGYQMGNQPPPHVSMMHPRNGSHAPMHMHSGPMPPHGNMQMNGSSAPLRSIHQMNNTFGLSNHMDGPMHNNRGMMMPGNGMGGGGMNAGGMNPGAMNAGGMNAGGMNAGGMNAGGMNAGGMNAGGINAGGMNANANSNMSSMNPLGQLAQMNNSPNSHLSSMNSPNGSRMGSSSPSLAVNSPNMGLNGNRVQGSSSPHLGMNSPNLAQNPGARMGNSPLNNLNAMNTMNVSSMGSPINQNPHVMKNNGQMCPSMNNLNSLNSPIGNVHPGQQMMQQQGPLPPPRMNMANGSHGNPMNPNMMPMPSNQSPQQQMQSMHAQNMNRNNMPISPISPMPPATNSPLSSLSSMSPLSSLSSLSSMVGQPNQSLSSGPKNVPGMNPGGGGMMNPHGPNPNANMQPFPSPHHQITPGMSPQSNAGGPPNMMMKLDQPGNFDNSMMMKNDQIPSNPNFDTSGNMNMMKNDSMSGFDNSNPMMMKNDPGMPPNMGPNHPMMNNPLNNVMKQNQLPPSQCLPPNNMGLMSSNFSMQHQSMPPCNYNSPHMANKPYITNAQNPSAPPTYNCGKCGKEINDNDEALFCESNCKFFYHRLCVGVSEADFQRFMKDANTEFKCEKCLDQTALSPAMKLKS